MSTDVFSLPVFEPADVFPMMADDELAELAEDIKENGLRDPIVLAEFDGKTMLVDGRNRRAACELAGIEPETRALNGEDPTAFVLSANIHRRHMTKGQRAMAVAKVLETNTISVSAAARESNLNRTRVAQANTVLRYAPDHADSVLSGAVSLDEAYRTARDRKVESEGTEAQLAALRGQAPDLADKVVEGELTLVGAQSEAKERDAQERSRRQSLFMGLRDARRSMRGFIKSDVLPELPALLRDEDIREEFAEVFQGSPDELREMIAEIETELDALRSIVLLLDPADGE